jgi:UDP-GlcNAc:undecaprenyl-phosphate GlcNAc-1-phosphate transferase
MAPILLASFGFTVGFSLLVLKFFPALGLMDRPERYGHARPAIPYPGGVAAVLSILLCSALFLKENPLVLSLLSSVLLLGMTCFLDDRRGLSPWLRLGVQLLAALLLIMGGLGVSSITNPLGGTIVLDAWQIPLHLGTWTFNFTVLADLLTVVWLISITNAFNWIDGVPGMANGVGTVAALAILILSLRTGFHSVDQSLAIALSSMVLGASLGSLFFDFPPPRYLLGDTGSMVTGFLLAVAAMISGGKIATTVLVLGFPLLDFVWVILRRVLKGQSPLKGDLWHFHHRLQKAGYSDAKIVLFFIVTSALFGSMALMLHTEGKAVALVGIFALMALLVLVLYSKK